MKAAYGLMNFIGMILAIWAGVSYGKFDPSMSLFSHPHWWLLLLICLTNPRALAILYLCCAQPTVSHWFWVVLFGCFIAPNAWGLYFLPGLSAGYGLRIFLLFVGLIRDAIEDAVLLGKRD
jgi:hypothetical protein